MVFKLLSKKLQKVVKDLWDANKEKLGELKPVDALRVAIQAAKNGIEIERKALGLADQVINIQFVKETAKEFITIVAKYVRDEGVLKNISEDIQLMVERETSNLEVAISKEVK